MKPDTRLAYIMAAACLSALLGLPESAQAQAAGALPPPQAVPPGMQPARMVDAFEYTLASRHTGKTYRIQVSALGSPPPQGYPVLYLLDGDAFFPQALSAAQNMWMRAQDNNAVPLLLVGVGYPNGQLLDIPARAEDYTPPSADYRHSGDNSSQRFGGADAFRRFLQQELQADLARRFALNPRQQNLFGHSYGGLFALHTLLTEPQSFRNYLIASPSVWWNQERIWQDWPPFARRLQQMRAPAVGVRLTVGEYEEHAAPHWPENSPRRALLAKRGMVRQIRAWGNKLAGLPENRMQVHTRVYAAETHASSVVPALNDGLKWLYARCRADADCAVAVQAKP
ncbi:putative alpha/beta superfamily hydrolase [Neisseria sp. HSC-16F19]|nr:alpha/beta hydrolase-fold protein [Neisseria sp. HSC-16F19]MCP2040232.1 putative alpha/beta superfamily hydrolase [Neisseria sp. HSC-16F19]